MQTLTPVSSSAPQRRGWSIKLTIASVVVMAMAILAASIISLGWVGARQSLVDAAAKSARDAGLLITEKSFRLLEPAQVTLRLLASTALVDAKTTEERLKGTGRMLVRKSGTEPLVRIMAEGDDEALVRAAVAEVKSAVVAAARAA